MYILDELQALANEGYGKLVTKDQMVADKHFAYNQCCTMYMKPHPDFVDKKLLKMAKDEDLTLTYYTTFFNKRIEDATTKKILAKYHPNLDMLYLSSLDDSPDSSSGI